ncbi:hypothetical protein TRICHSKD4_1156 [Roseibium sp. TrichSKD4]|nr:hypothetical protein TRICHSKD4_1156 [Roseibium sp. TrichSKD4]
MQNDIQDKMSIWRNYCSKSRLDIFDYCLTCLFGQVYFCIAYKNVFS